MLVQINFGIALGVAGVGNPAPREVAASSAEDVLTGDANTTAPAIDPKVREQALNAFTNYYQCRDGRWLILIVVLLTRRPR